MVSQVEANVRDKAKKTNKYHMTWERTELCEYKTAAMRHHKNNSHSVAGKAKRLFHCLWRDQFNISIWAARELEWGRYSTRNYVCVVVQFGPGILTHRSRESLHQLYLSALPSYISPSRQTSFPQALSLYPSGVLGFSTSEFHYIILGKYAKRIVFVPRHWTLVPVSKWNCRRDGAGRGGQNFAASSLFCRLSVPRRYMHTE